MFDTHAHTRFSPDGRSTMAEYIALLKKGFLSGMGFTEHFDFMPCCGGYKYLKVEDYLAETGKYKEQGYDVHAGVEIDYNRQVEEKILQTLEQVPLDYTICSVHMIDGKPVSDKPDPAWFQDADCFGRIVDTYFDEVTASLKVKAFDIIGHIAIYARYLDREFLNAHPNSKRMDERLDALANACAQSDKIIEVNTSGLFNKMAATVPDVDFLSTYYRYGGRSVSLGSDAHQAGHLARGFDTAIEMLRDIGFRYLTLPWDRENPVKIIK